MTVKIGCLVEGESEVKTVPLLIRRIAAHLYPELQVVVPPPIRRPRNKVVKENELERAVEFVAQQIGGQGAILIIFDSDDDCPAELGPVLLDRATQARSDLPIAVVLAKHEFETWFLATAESLRGQKGLGNNIHPPNDPEAIRDAKGWLSQRMGNNRKYRETRDQPALAARFDIERARQADSFDKCYRDIVRLLHELRQATETIDENV